MSRWLLAPVKPFVEAKSRLASVLTPAERVLLMRSLFGLRLTHELNTILLGITAASVLAWLALLRVAGEDSAAAPAPFGPEHESRLLIHLDSLNAALLRSSRQKPALPRTF